MVCKESIKDVTCCVSASWQHGTSLIGDHAMARRAACSRTSLRPIGSVFFCVHSVRLNSTQLNRVSFSRDPWCQPQYQYYLLNYWRNVWRVQKCTWKSTCWKKRLFRVAVDMDIHGYIHVWISDLGHAVDASTDVWYQCLISDTGIRINDFTICVCIGDADILLLLRMFYTFLFFLCSSYSSFPPNLRSLLFSGIERHDWTFNAMRRMVSIRGRLL